MSVCGDKATGNLLEDYEDAGPQQKRTPMKFHKKKCGGKRR
jgi:hypothetical protein